MDNTSKKKVFLEGLRDGVPIGLGYLVVSFALGIAARNVGMDAVQGFFMSLFNLASAGEYAGILAISSKATLLGTALITFITNLRYLLMSCSISQKLDPNMPTRHRLFIGFGLTDEIFAISNSRKGYVHPFYVYGALAVAAPLWAIGTSLGIVMGNILPVSLVSAFSVALFGMFLAIIIPEGKRNKVVLGLMVLSFVSSYLLNRYSSISGSMQVVILTVVLSVLAALLFPIKDKEDTENE